MDKLQSRNGIQIHIDPPSHNHKIYSSLYLNPIKEGNQLVGSLRELSILAMITRLRNVVSTTENKTIGMKKNNCK